jgi:hypothetical protein
VVGIAERLTHDVLRAIVEVLPAQEEGMMRRTMVEAHAEDAGKRGALIFEVEGNKEEFDEGLRAADHVTKLMAGRAGETPKEFAVGVLRRLPWAANQKDDPDERRLMEMAVLYVVKNSPTRVPDRTIRNCSLKMSNDEINVHIWYVDDEG